MTRSKSFSRGWQAGALVLAALGFTAATGLAHGATAPAAGPAAPNSAILSFDRLPGPTWYAASCSGAGSTSVAHGFLTIDSPDGDCREYLLYAPDGGWNTQARNARGWVVEAALALDPSSTGSCASDEGVELWLHDDVELIKVGIAADGVCLAYPDYQLAPVATTDGLHTYRVEARGRIVRVYVDGRLVIDHTLTARGAGTRALAFGDGSGAVASLSRWDYLRYQTRPGFDPAAWAGSAWPAGTRSAHAVRLASTAAPVG